MKYKCLITKQSSVNVAKERLQQLLCSDRVHCTPDLINQMQDDVYSTISKYIELSPDVFEFNLTRTDINIRFAGEK